MGDTREQVAELNAPSARLVGNGRVDDAPVVVTGAGERTGAGDWWPLAATTATVGAANRDTWMVTAVDRCGGPRVALAEAVTGDVRAGLPPAATGARVLAADYAASQVELTYATTAVSCSLRG